MAEEIQKTTQELPIKFEPIAEKLTKLFSELPEEKISEVNAVLVPFVESVGKLCDNLPLIIKGTTNAEKAMQKWQSIEDDEDEEQVMALLGKVKQSYEVNTNRRKEITEAGDKLKAFAIQFEKKVSDDAKEKNEYNRLRSMVQQRQQKKLDEKREQERLAARRREIENYKVELGLQVTKELSSMLTFVVTKADSGSKDYFDKLTLENFDEKAAIFSNWKPKLKIEDYDKCFVISFDSSKINDADYKELVSKLKSEETYDKWNALVMEQTAPFIEAWKAKIPQLKADKEAIAKANSEEEKKRIEKEQAEKAEFDERRRVQALKARQDQIDKENEEAASLKKLENDFQEQATVQSLEDAGLSKKVLRYKSVKDFPKAFAAIVYHCMMHKDFPGIFKLDKNKQAVKDAIGRAEYRDEIKWWNNFFMQKCDAKPEGVDFEEDSKIIVKK